MNELYKKYIPLIFDNDGDIGTDQYFNDDLEKDKLEYELLKKPSLVLDILNASFVNFDSYLSNYSPYQLSNALDYIFNPSLSDYGFIFKNTDLDHNKRVETLNALADFMIYIFQDTAEPVLGHLSQNPRNKKKMSLNGVCYMFWDTACIPYGCEKGIVDACLAVMGKCAKSSNIALVEGALHGLGHAESPYSHKIIQKYISEANFGEGPKSEALRTYAKSARNGRVL